MGVAQCHFENPDFFYKFSLPLCFNYVAIAFSSLRNRKWKRGWVYQKNEIRAQSIVEFTKCECSKRQNNFQDTMEYHHTQGNTFVAS